VSIDVDEHGRPHPPQNASEIASVLGFLEHQRATLEWKCVGLDSDGLSASAAATTMTLGGLLKHMAYVEDSWFSVWLPGNKKAAPWDEVDWQADQDWDWNSAKDDTPQQLFTLWSHAVDRSRSLVDQAIDEGGLDGSAKRTWPDGTSPSLRWVLLHMIEEYARHNGHADLLRESVDGETGE
jgi:uncharacterized damage-inducible protein DinB